MVAPAVMVVATFFAFLPMVHDEAMDVISFDDNRPLAIKTGGILVAFPFEICKVFEEITILAFIGESALIDVLSYVAFWRAEEVVWSDNDSICWPFYSKGTLMANSVPAFK